MRDFAQKERRLRAAQLAWAARVPYGRRVASDVRERYEDLLTGSYWVERMVLNALSSCAHPAGSGCGGSGWMTGQRSSERSALQGVHGRRGSRLVAHCQHEQPQQYRQSRVAGESSLGSAPPGPPLRPPLLMAVIQVVEES